MKLPSIRDVARELVAIKHDLADFPDLDCDGEEPWVDVRLQVEPGGAWSIHEGDPCFDTDHRGYWGASCLTRSSNCRSVARDLIDQCADHYDQCR